MTDFALGARVAYHHRAAVARWMTKDFHGVPPDRNGRWGLFEGARRNSVRLADACYEVDLFADWPEQIRGRADRPVTVNKTVMVWPEEGVGVIVGQVRRQRGTSHRSVGNGEDFDPGYFDSTDTFTLYAIRHDLRGLDYVLVPTWAVSLA